MRHAASAASARSGIASAQIWALARDKNNYRQDFHDITVGNNTLFGLGLRPAGLHAGPGYDYATGLGTPDVSRLLKDLAGHDGQQFSFDGMFQSHGDGKHGKHFSFGAGD